MLNTPANTSGGNSAPKAYLNIIFFDERFVFDEAASQVMPVAYTNGIGNINRLAGNAPEAKRNGYVYVYFSNESDELVYFDNFMLSHERGPLLEETHYYPFGLAMARISSKAMNFGGTENKYKYNNGSELQSKEFSDGSGLELYDATFRMYDPQIGRFHRLDPMSDVMYELSPFCYANNNPLTFNDPLGLLSDSAHPQQLQEVVVTAKMNPIAAFKRYIHFPNGQEGSVASKNDWPLSFSKDRSNDLLDSWGLGLGATSRIYLPNHPMTKRLKNAWEVNKARALFYKKYLSDYKKGISLKGASLPTYEGTFGLTGLILAGTDIVEQFVGGFMLDIKVDDKGENMLFVLSNTTGRESAFYHLANDIERDPNVAYPAQGNLYQVYIWKEPITAAGFNNVENGFRDTKIIK